MFWRRLGDFISAIITKGLHIGNNVSPQVSLSITPARISSPILTFSVNRSRSGFANYESVYLQVPTIWTRAFPPLWVDHLGYLANTALCNSLQTST
jgi:hypothetical protein